MVCQRVTVGAADERDDRPRLSRPKGTGPPSRRLEARKPSAAVATSVHMEMGAVQLVSRGAPKAPPDKSKPVEDTSKPDWQRKYMAARSERKNQRKAAIRASRGSVLRQEALDRQQAGQPEEGADAKKAGKKKNKVHAAVTSPRDSQS